MKPTRTLWSEDKTRPISDAEATYVACLCECNGCKGLESWEALVKGRNAGLRFCQIREAHRIPSYHVSDWALKRGTEFALEKIKKFRGMDFPDALAEWRSMLDKSNTEAERLEAYVRDLEVRLARAKWQLEHHLAVLKPFAKFVKRRSR